MTDDDKWIMTSSRSRDYICTPSAAAPLARALEGWGVQAGGDGRTADASPEHAAILPDETPSPPLAELPAEGATCVRP